MKRRKSKIKRYVALLMSMAMIATTNLTVSADETVGIVLNGTYCSFSDSDGTLLDPIVKDGVTYLPLRALAQAVGREIEWDGATNTVYLGTKGNASYSADIKVYINGKQLNSIDSNGKNVPPFVVNGRTYLPVRAVGEALGIDVDWDGATNSVFLTTPDNELYRLVLYGDWNDLPNSDAYIKAVEEEFRLYPKINARWGDTGIEKRSVIVDMSSEYGADNPSSVAGTSELVVRVSKAYVLKHADDTGFYGHEFAHIAQSYQGFNASWWTEHLADYARFRYFVPTKSGQKAEHDYDKNDPEIRDWGWDKNPYGKCEWFFAYMDWNYPTVQNSDGTIKLGLIDSLNAAIKSGKVKSDGGGSHNDPDFNAIVKSFTGYDNIDLLRLKYVSDLDSGKWTFNGFDDYKDNFITENVNVKTDTVRMSENLAQNTTVVQYESKYSIEDHAPAHMIDGDYNTNWQSGPTVGETSAVIDLGKQTTFNSYTLVKECFAGDNHHVPLSWKILTSDDMRTWYLRDSRMNSTRTVESYRMREVTARYIKIEISSADAANGLPIIGEFMLFNN